MNRTILIIVTVAIVLGGVGVLAYTSISDMTPYKHVEEVTAKPEKFLAERQVQIHGFARNVPDEGKIVGEKIYREFDIESKGERIHVVHEGVVPDTFKEMGETVVTGHLARENGRLVLTTVGGEKGIAAKCPSKYDQSK